ncbi:MAG: hypothetical protein ACTHMI_07320 [Mucilaginibacter sp.]
METQISHIKGNMLSREQMRNIKGGYLKRCVLFINHGTYYTETTYNCSNPDTCDTEGNIQCQDTQGCTGYTCDDNGV